MYQVYDDGYLKVDFDLKKMKFRKDNMKNFREKTIPFILMVANVMIATGVWATLGWLIANK